VLADIYLGKIAKWNAGPIRELNPGLALPDQAIIPIHRADGSGTTFILADYLAGQRHVARRDRREHRGRVSNRDRSQGQ
jgi:ABC-type phosphate transport system substrate-binding protein